jgi:eukaryotic-like serine/threonine-protein kinase
VNFGAAIRVHQASDIIAHRYRIERILGQGGTGITYEAIALSTGQAVALKVLSLRQIADWKVLELFEREGKILAQLNHPAIPRYLDCFQVDSDEDKMFYLVQALAPGKSLAAWIEQGWQPTEVEVEAIAVQILEILTYLQSLTPPIIHRDLKPQNIIRQDNGQLYLVDFGGVQDTYRHTVTRNSTIVGTFGYMAPEQFRGQAVLATDLYGLGATLLFLLTRKSPADLPQRQLKIKFRSHVRLSKFFANWLEKLIEPVIDDRLPSAEAALAVLQGKESLVNYANPKPRRPRNSSITLTQTEAQLVLEIPPVGFSSTTLAIALLLIVGNGFLLQIVWLIWVSSIENFIPSFFFFLFFCIYAPLGLRLLGMFLFSPVVGTCLAIDSESFQLKRRFLSWRLPQVKGHTSDLAYLGLKDVGLPQKSIAFTAHQKRKLRTHHFGLFLTQSEQEWLVAWMRDWLKKQQKLVLSSSSNDITIIQHSIGIGIRSGIVAFGITLLGAIAIHYPLTIKSGSSPLEILFACAMLIVLPHIVGGVIGFANGLLFNLILRFNLIFNAIDRHPEPIDKSSFSFNLFSTLFYGFVFVLISLLSKRS